ncbi:MAG: 2-phosphosulfolactate phosphatase [Acidimicrobiia bacterium]
MTAPTIVRRSLLEGAEHVSGATVVIDTFRAFSTAAYLVDRGVDHIVLTETLDEARRQAATIPDSVLCGEDGGRKPDDFDLGNSPVEAAAFPVLDGRTVIMRTSGGTRTIVRALKSGADPVYAASLVIAASTAAAVRGSRRVTIIASGLGGVSVADEDEETAGLISDRILGRPDDPARIGRIQDGEGAARLRSTPWIDSEDLARCLDVDRFSFALRASLNGSVATLRAGRSTESDTGL